MLSKPQRFIKSVSQKLLISYFENLYLHPYRTKALTSCIIAVLGNILAQHISGVEKIDQRSTLAYGLFGLTFGWYGPHMFYIFLDSYLPRKKDYALIKRFLTERFIYIPVFQLFVLFILSVLEGNALPVAFKNAESVYPKVLLANWKYLSLLQFINLAYVPPMLRVLFNNLISFFWTIFLSQQRRKLNQKSKK